MKFVVAITCLFVFYGCGSTQIRVVEEGNPAAEKIFQKLMNASPVARANDIRFLIVSVKSNDPSALHTPALSVHVLGTGSLVLWTTKMLEEPKEVWPFVMGHEIAHALLAHALVFGRSQDIELYADRVGFQLATYAGYDPSQLVRYACRFFQKMDRIGKFTNTGAKNRTHPDAKIRCDQLKMLLEHREFDVPSRPQI